MTVLVKDNYKLFHGTGSTGPFTWTWRFMANGEIRVTKIVGGIETLLVEGADYLLAGARSYQGGSLILTANLEEGEDLLVKRSTEPLQAVSIRNQGNNFRPEVHEDVFDRLTMMVQDQDRDINDLKAEIAAVAAAVAGAASGVSYLYVESAANGPVVLPAKGDVYVAKAAGDVSADPLHIIPGVLGQTIEGAESYRDGLTGGGESVHLVFNSSDNTWYKF